MKILKILFIVLVPAIAIVGCRKSDSKPRCDGNQEGTVTVTSTTENNATYENNVAAPESTLETPAITVTSQNAVTPEDAVTAKSADLGNTNTGAKLVNGSGEDEGTTDVVASGDDDRDGGDKKKKK